RVERHLAGLDVGGLDRRPGEDLPGRDDDRRHLQLALSGRLLGVVDQVERGATGDEGQEHAEDDDDPASAGVVPVLHLHRAAIPPGWSSWTGPASPTPVRWGYGRVVPVAAAIGT